MDRTAEVRPLLLSIFVDCDAVFIFGDVSLNHAGFTCAREKLRSSRIWENKGC